MTNAEKGTFAEVSYRVGADFCYPMVGAAAPTLGFITAILSGWLGDF
jgi:hypothetical protein